MNPTAQEFEPQTKNENISYKTPGNDKIQFPVSQPTRLSAAAPPFIPHGPNSSASNPVNVKIDMDSHHVDPSPALPAFAALSQKTNVVEMADREPELSVAEAKSSEILPSSLGHTKTPLHSVKQVSSVEGTPSQACSVSNASKPTPIKQQQHQTTTNSAWKEFSELKASPLQWASSRLPTIFDCPNTKKAPPPKPVCLHCAWELYADDHSSASSSSNNTVPSSGSARSTPFDPVHIATVVDLEGFWRLWRYVRPPSCCTVPFTYSWFRKDIKPEWEYPRNKRGGTITIIIFDRDRPGLNDKQILDDAFMMTVMSCAGESFAECSSTLNGVMLKLRPNKPFTLQFWTSHSESNKLKTFANSLRDALSKVMEDTKLLQKIEYYSHHRSQVASNSLASRLKTKPKVSPDYVF